MTKEKKSASSAWEEPGVPREAPPCFVRHEDAGGQCDKPATTRVYGLWFCEAHGDEARLGASLEEHLDARYFFERFRGRHVPASFASGLVDRELGNVLKRLHGEGAADGEHHRALVRAYPVSRTPEKVRERIVEWESDEGPGRAPVMDALLDSLLVVNELMRIAHKKGETWLVEVLEVERQSVAALAAYAMRDR